MLALPERAGGADIDNRTRAAHIIDETNERLVVERGGRDRLDCMRLVACTS
jgi:hypothetical protein